MTSGEAPFISHSREFPPETMDYDAHGFLLFLLPIRDLCLRRAHAEGGLDADSGIHG